MIDEIAQLAIAALIIAAAIIGLDIWSKHPPKGDKKS